MPATHLNDCCLPGQAKALPEAGQLAALQRDNAILKRAVAIQNGRLQELAGREAEMTQLRTLAKVNHCLALSHKAPWNVILSCCCWLAFFRFKST